MNLSYYYSTARLAVLFLIGMGAGCDSPEVTSIEEEPLPTCRTLSHLVEPEFVLDRLQANKRTFILDVSPREKYQSGHLPGARQIWRGDYANKSDYAYGGMKADSQTIGQLLACKGLNRGDTLFLYDRRGDVDAARFLWILKTYGFSNAHLINGGWQRWKVLGFPIDSLDEEVLEAGDFSFGGYDFVKEPEMSMEDVQHAIKDSTWVILDTRSLDEYTGKVQKKGAFRKGRIPTSIHLDWIDMIQSGRTGDHRFKSCTDIEPLLEERGIDPAKKVITYCHSGVRSAHMLFVLREIMGYPYVWNYDGSWTEWSYFEELPIEI